MELTKLPPRPQRRLCLLAALLLAMLAVFVASPAAKAHFDLEMNVRIIHVEHANEGLRVYIRLPTPYLLATPDQDAAAEQSRADKPFVLDEEDDGRTLHRLDVDALRNDATAFAALITDGHVVEVDGEALIPADVETRVYLVDRAPAFSTLTEARSAFEAPHSIGDLGTPFVGETLTDALLLFPYEGPVLRYDFSSRLNPGLAGQEATVNLLADHFPGATRIYRASGILSEPIEVSRSAFTSLYSFVVEGVIHIIEGLDHVLFVICLVLGALTFSGLLWRVTGFTLGHTVTLSLGFFGFVPKGAWFVPTVETFIALSIIYAAAVALVAPEKRAVSERNWFAITGLIGLLHGLGFSFVLQKILQVDSPDVWQSLLAFNVGVELGQLLIVMAVWPLALILTARYATAWKYLRATALGACILISTVWAFERMSTVIQTL